MICIKSIDNEIAVLSSAITVKTKINYDDIIDIVCNDVVLATFNSFSDADKVINRIWDQIERGKTTINMEDLV